MTEQRNAGHPRASSQFVYGQGKLCIHGVSYGERCRACEGRLRDAKRRLRVRQQTPPPSIVEGA